MRHASAPARAIPDNDANGIAERITVPESGTIADLGVEVDIAHPWIGEPTVELVSRPARACRCTRAPAVRPTT